MVEKSDSKVDKSREEDTLGDLDQEDGPEMASLEAKAEFDEVIVWGHEATADAGADPYVRSIEEWVDLAEQIHSHPSPQ